MCEYRSHPRSRVQENPTETVIYGGGGSGWCDAVTILVIVLFVIAVCRGGL